MGQYLYQVFRSMAGKIWSYDAVTNRLARLDGLKANVDVADKRLEQYLARSGCIKPARLEKTAYRVSGEEYFRILDGYAGRITLELTQQCNLRCSYCVYSGRYFGERVHTNKAMTEETACKALDLFAGLSRRREAVTVSFYGGESLLQFDKIKTIVKYARHRLNKKIYFRIGTNGTLCSQELYAWLDANRDVFLDVTLNGYVQDRYRRYVNGDPTLDDILCKLQEIRTCYPDMIGRQINFICNAASNGELEEIREFYREFHISPAMITGIERKHGDAYIASLGREDPERETSVLAYLKRMYLDTEDAFLCALFDPGLLRIHCRDTEVLGSRAILEGTCLPLVANFFVHADGSYTVCEKIAESSLGNVEDGLDKKILSRFMEEYQEALEGTCKRCWAQRLCTVCYRDLYFDGRFSAADREVRCREMRQSLLDDLSLYVSLYEHNPERFRRFDQIEISE